MKHKNNTIFLFAALFFAGSAILSLRYGSVYLSLPDLWHAVHNGPSDSIGYIFWYHRLPRTAASLLSGSALAVSGCVIQSVLNNKLASPGIIGVNAGAGLAVTICCAAGLLSGWVIAVSSFAGAMLSVFLVVLIARKTGASRSTVILSGVAVNSILNALSEAITTLLPSIAMQSSEFRIGGFSSVVHTRLFPAAILIACALILVFTLHNELDILALGEDTAHSLGMKVRQMRTLFLILAAMLAGASVSFGGLLGFVGLIVPHAARKLVGSENRKLLILCALSGAAFVTLSDLISRMIFAPHELPVGILMSVIGGPFFLLLLIRRKGGRSND